MNGEEAIAYVCVCVSRVEFGQRNGRVEVSSKSVDENYCQSRQLLKANAS